MLLIYQLASRHEVYLSTKGKEIHMKKKKIIVALLCTAFVGTAFGQSKILTGKILSSRNLPVKGAVLSFPGMDNVTTGKDGTFKVSIKDNVRQVSVWAPGYYSVTQPLAGRTDIVIMLVDENKYKYNESAVLPFRQGEERPNGMGLTNISNKDFALGDTKIDQALAGQVAGLQVTKNSGMPGEGSYINLRGIRSLTADNAPLVVINNVPYLFDSRQSPLIGGFSRNMFQDYSLNDIANITVLKGDETSLYGSLGSNGVIMVETNGANAEDMDTRVSFYGKYGVAWNSKRMPLLSGKDYKSYLTDVGMTYFNEQENMFNEFPFLGSSNDKYGYLYNFQTNWQDLLYRNAFVTDNTARIEGGDEIAKYDLSLGYSRDEGILKGTSLDDYHTQLNADVMISKWVSMNATVGMSYLSGKYQNQGMSAEYNPLLAAYARSPFLSPYETDTNGEGLKTYSKYYYGKSENMDFAVSNPIAIINTLDATSKQYDINVRASLVYKPTMNLIFTGTFGLYYNYNKESMFIPGVTDKAIVPVFDKYGEMDNVVREGVGTTMNYFGNLNARYMKTFDGIHDVNALVGMQFAITDKEYDAGIGRNTPNDFYQTLGDVNSIGVYFDGYAEKWNWMNYYLHADYTYNKLLKFSANMSVDGSSSSGADAARFYVYPSVGLTWMAKNWKPLANLTWINILNLRADYTMTGNSRFSSKYGKFYYTSSPYDKVSGIVRANNPNVNLKPERNSQFNLGLDLTALNNRIDLSLDWYTNKTTDGVMPISLSPAYGTSPYYDNVAEIQNNGIELSVAASILRLKDFEWVIGGNIAKNISEIKSLGGEQQRMLKYSDGSAVISRVGDTPYQYYGYVADGVFATQAEADKANLVNSKNQKYGAGDVRFVDQNGDGRIDDNDRVALGSIAPDYFGGFFTHLRYREFSLSASFTYSKGNKAYNAVRRSLESMSSTVNQSTAVNRRWSMEGQVTDMPKAVWGDPIGNNDFSSRWIEDASYLRMKDITLSYEFNKTFLNFFRSGTIYITGENLFTFTKYLGLDPEFSYSPTDATQGFDYAKVMQPKAVKIGFNLKF